MPNYLIPDNVLKAIFENVIQKTKENQTKGLDELSKYALTQYYIKEKHHFNLLEKNFIDAYVYNESLIENTKSKEEKEGLKDVYEYIFENNDNNIDIYYLLDLHRILFSKVPCPEVGGHFRTAPARLEGVNLSLCNYEDIPNSINSLNKKVKELVSISHKVYGSNPEELFKYIEECIKLNTKLIYIHPFFDGNGRSVRAFTNKLFTMAGVPPVYISGKEKDPYHKAMQKAIENEDYEDIINFYYLKICQSIYDLDLNPNKDLKIENDFRKIVQIVENYKQGFNANGHNIDDLSYHYIYQIKKYLEKENIISNRNTVKNTENNKEYSYLMALITDGQIKEDVLIDPTFSSAVGNHFIDIYQTLNNEEKDFLKDLYLTGVARPTARMLEIYFEVLGILGKSNDFECKKCNKCQKQLVKH